MVGCGQAKASDRLSRSHLREPMVLLLLTAEPPDRVHRKGTLDGHERADSRVGRFQFEAGEPVVDSRHPCAPVTRQVHPQQPQFAELSGQSADVGKGRFLEPLSDVRRDRGVAESSYDITNISLVGGELVVEPERVERVEIGAGHRASMSARILASQVASYICLLYTSDAADDLT